MGEDDNDDEAALFFHQTFDYVKCINLKRRPDRWQAFTSQSSSVVGADVVSKIVERVDAVDGILLTPDTTDVPPNECKMEWDASENAKYDPHIRPPMIKQCTMGEVGCTLSHVALWKELVAMAVQEEAPPARPDASMLILEDDAIFHPTFSSSFSKMWKLVPEDWDIFYLGFCNVGPVTPVVQHKYPQGEGQHDCLTVSIVRPSYGFYTHAYALRTKAAQTLVSQLPVVGPIDTWLADNAWFGMNVYYGVIGRSTCIIGQQRKDLKNDIVHSAHCRD
mmetsp:Transcript_36701/g.89036  ORF Transcript_36701/g.89036 Transcript_36701/m.89036 type:complete len:277 (+) Transcript_36701:236-1066(+)